MPFFKRVHGFFVKTLKFLYPFLQSNWGRKKCSGKFYLENKPFYTLILESRNFAFFQKGFVHGFYHWKIWYFFIPFFGKISLEKEFMNLLYQKTPFETYENMNLIYIFPKGFLSKIWNFFILSFWAKWAKKKSLWTFYIEKMHFQTIKKCDLRRSQNLHFFQNGTSMVVIWQGKIAGYLQKTSLLDSRVRVKFSPWPSSSNFRLM